MHNLTLYTATLSCFALKTRLLKDQTQNEHTSQKYVVSRAMIIYIHRFIAISYCKWIHCRYSESRHSMCVITICARSEFVLYQEIFNHCLPFDRIIAL